MYVVSEHSREYVIIVFVRYFVDTFVKAAAQDMTSAAQDHCNAYRQPLGFTR